MCDCETRVHPGISCGSERCNCHIKPSTEIYVKPETNLERELSDLLNKYSAESVSGTPDFILAEFMLDTIKAFNEAVWKRAQWRGEPVDFESTPKG